MFYYSTMGLGSTWYKIHKTCSTSWRNNVYVIWLLSLRVKYRFQCMRSCQHYFTKVFGFFFKHKIMQTTLLVIFVWLFTIVHIITYNIFYLYSIFADLCRLYSLTNATHEKLGSLLKLYTEAKKKSSNVPTPEPAMQIEPNTAVRKISPYLLTRKEVVQLKPFYKRKLNSENAKVCTYFELCQLYDDNSLGYLTLSYFYRMFVNCAIQLSNVLVIWPNISEISMRGLLNATNVQNVHFSLLISTKWYAIKQASTQQIPTCKLAKLR